MWRVRSWNVELKMKFVADHETAVACSDIDKRVIATLQRLMQDAI